MRRPTNYFNRFPAPRQFQITATDHQFVDQFKQNVGYTYGPPPTTQFSHDNRLHIYLFQNKLSIYCATDTTYEVRSIIFFQYNTQTIRFDSIKKYTKYDRTLRDKQNSSPNRPSTVKSHRYHMRRSTCKILISNQYSL